MGDIAIVTCSELLCTDESPSTDAESLGWVLEYDGEWRCPNHAVPIWAPVVCTNAIACPLTASACGAARGERCRTDRPIHLERWDAWRATGFSQ